MRLNIDCLRDLLLAIEENTGYQRAALFLDVEIVQKMNDFLEVSTDMQDFQVILLQSYSNAELMYHLRYLVEARLITIQGEWGGSQCLVLDLTPAGHSFIGDLRSSTVFEKAKALAEKLGIASVPAFQQLAAKLMHDIIHGV